MKNSEKQKSPIVNLYGIRDIKAGRFFPPFTSENHITASRSFRQMAMAEKSVIGSMIGDDPQDFQLFHLGDFDPNDGQIDVVSQPFHICDAYEFFNQPETNHA